MKSILARAIALLALLLVCVAVTTAAEARRNVLLIMADDLNTLLGCYGDPHAKTPNIDKLAARGVRFERAYCTYPVCGQSRNSMLTGLYPNTTGILENSQIFRQTIPNHVSLPHAFRLRGYFSGRIGKLFHFNVPESIGTVGHDDPAAWELDLNPAGVDRLAEQPRVFSLAPPAISATLSWYASPNDDPQHTDAKIATEAEWVLERFARQAERPFFFALGFFRPHTPFIAPQRYFDLYRETDMPVRRRQREGMPDLPPAALGRPRPEQENMTDTMRQRAVLAYLACISFVDAQVGRVIAALDRLGLAESTTIVFTSDHGYLTGEHGLWQKTSLFEPAARVPLIVVAPGVTRPGTVAKTPVSLIDVYPTLAELGGVKLPANLQGQSLVPMLKDPAATGRGWALTQVGRTGNQLRVPTGREPSPDTGRFFGYSIRTARWRYTEWDEGRQGRELYDHESDPNELANLAAVSSHQTTVSELSRQLHAAVSASFPPGGKTPELRPGLWSPRLPAP